VDSAFTGHIAQYSALVAIVPACPWSNYWRARVVLGAALVLACSVITSHFALLMTLNSLGKTEFVVGLISSKNLEAYIELVAAIVDTHCVFRGAFFIASCCAKVPSSPCLIVSEVSDTIAILFGALVLAGLVEAILGLSVANYSSITANLVSHKERAGIELGDTVLPCSPF
jgi:hypothetical protein